MDEELRKEIAKPRKNKTSTSSSAPKVPPPAEESDIAIKKGTVYGPKQIPFGKIYGKGLVNYGITTISQFFQQDPNAFPKISSSLKRVVQAVSENEGRIEAINTYDNSFISCGIFQWTAGAGSGAGELAGLLGLLQKEYPTSFATFFGSLGIGVSLKKGSATDLIYGYLTLNG